MKERLKLQTAVILIVCTAALVVGWYIPKAIDHLQARQHEPVPCTTIYPSNGEPFQVGECQK